MVHADGNGLGQIFLNLGKDIEENRDYVHQLRYFSLALDLCTENAFKAALDVFPLKEGIMIKPHFPFYVAYELAESLLKSAKKVKNNVIHQETGNPLPCSALDFHIVYDSSGVELDSIRQRLQGKAEGFDLYKRPLVITEVKQLQEAKFSQWAEFYHWHEFEKKVNFLRQKNESGNYNFPPSQANKLRSACFVGKAETDAEYKLIKQRYQESQGLNSKGVQKLLIEESADSLFSQVPGHPDKYVTGFIDALDAVEFIKVKEEQ